MLCRLALAPRAIDAATFTFVRVLAGAFTLVLVRAAARGAAGAEPATAPSRATSSLGVTRGGKAWLPAALLFAYAAPFSFAYLELGASTGALILFGFVQATMLIGAILQGERFGWLEGSGLAIALGGLTYLVSPGLSAPSPLGSALMAIAGIAWGIYSLKGRGSQDPLGDTTRNFVRAVPMAILLGALALHAARVFPRGVVLASASGALASGLGYTAWFAALRGLTALRAAMVQLTVPLLAAAGGVLFLGESVTLRLLISAALILGGVGLTLARKRGG